jgi:hypothetical protein
VRHTTNDYLHVMAVGWEGTDQIDDWWDVLGHIGGTMDQEAIFVTARPASGEVVFDTNPGNDSGAVTLTGLTAAAGRKLITATYFSFVEAKVYRRAYVVDSNGTVLITQSSDNVSIFADGALLGWAFNAGPFYGRLLLDFHGDARAVWESVALWMGKSWIRGVKSLDPRLMA